MRKYQTFDVMNLVKRLLEAMLWGIIFECIFGGILIWWLGFDVTKSHYTHLYQLNNDYLDDGLFVNTFFYQPLLNWVIQPMLHFFNHIQNGMNDQDDFVVLIRTYFNDGIYVFEFATVILLQKTLIAIVSLPIFLVFKLLGIYDGLIQRELRRYRCAIESNRGEKFARTNKRLMRITFITFLSIPIYFPAALWFAGFGIISAYFSRLQIKYIHKYW